MVTRIRHIRIQQVLFFIACQWLLIPLAYGQNTYYSQNTNSAFSNTGPGGDWNTAANGSGTDATAGDENTGTHLFIIQNTHTATVDTNINIVDLTVGDGDPDGAGAGVGTGTFTIGDNTTARSVTINGIWTVKAGAVVNVAAFNAVHTISLLNDLTVSTGQDNTGAASYNLFNATGQVANLTAGGTVATIIAGQNITFNDITFNGNQTRIITSALTVNGNLTVSGTGTSVTTSSTHTFLGNFNVNANNSWLSSSGLLNFNGTTGQVITINGVNGAAIFFQVDFEFGGASPNNKSIVGGLNVTDRTRVFNTAVIDDDPGSSHSVEEFQIDGTVLCTFSNTSTVTFTGGEIRFGAGTAQDGSLQVGDAMVVIAGNCGLEAGDNWDINNSFNIQSNYLAINGNSTGTEDATLTDLGSNTLTVTSNTNLYIRGLDNFPSSFTTYIFQNASRVRYDANFSQNIRGGASVTFFNMSMSQAEDQSGGATKTLMENIDIDGDLNMANGIILNLSGNNLNIGDDITNDDGARVSSATGDIILDGQDNNQSISGNVQYNLGAGTFNINRTATATAIRTISIDVNIEVDDFTATNTGGSTNNYLIVDIDGFEIVPVSSGTGSFTLGANVHYYTSGLQGFSDFSETITEYGTESLNSASVVRFDGSGAQLIPSPTGGYGSIELAGTNSKTATGNFVVANHFSRAASTPLFRDGGFDINIGGDWDMNDTYIDESNMTGSITFDGADQSISESEFNNVTFEGSGTKTLTGDLDLAGIWSIDGVIVDANDENIEVAGATWTESNNGEFRQTSGTTTFNGSSAQNITTDADSYFGQLTLNNSVAVIASTDITVTDDFDFGTGGNFLLTNSTLTVGGDWFLRVGATFTPGGSSTLIFNGTIAQNLYNYVSATVYDGIQFANSGEKVLREQIWDINGNLTIGSGTTLDGRSIGIELAGNWANSGTFQHANEVTFDGAAQNISASTFHDVDIAGSGTKTLTGNISCDGNFIITSTLDAGVSNYNIAIEEDWTNNGTFNSGSGTVTFTGAYSSITTGGTGAGKAFNHLVINVDDGQRAELLADVDIDGDLTVINGEFRMRVNVFLEGSLVNGGTLSQNTATTITFDDDDSGTSSIDPGSSTLYQTEINASGATYNLTGNTQMQQDEPLTITAGTLDLNGQNLEMGDGADGTPNAVINLNGGTLEVDEGAVLGIHEGSVFTNAGGTFRLVGVDGNPATITVNGDGFFEYDQTGASANMTAQYYVVASTQNDGFDFNNGTISNFSNGTFTSGTGTAYITFTNSFAIGNITASSVVFNSGPTNNVDATNAISGFIDFEVAGGTIAGSAFEIDDGVDATGFVRWTFPAGNTWTGTTSQDWHTMTNWSLGTIPDDTDFVYINSGTGPSQTTVNVTSQDAFAERIMILGTGMTLNLNGRDLIVADADSTEGNFTMQAGNTFTQGALDTLHLAGSWAEAGTYTPSSGSTIAFVGTDGAHTITPGGTGVGDRFQNLYFNASASAIYSLGALIRVDSDIVISGGTLDASSGYDIQLFGDWTVNGGTFSPGNAAVNLDAVTTTQNINGGTFYQLNIDGRGRKEINSNIQVANQLYIQLDGTGPQPILDGNENIIFVGGNWDNRAGAGSFTQTGAGTVIFNGAGQTIESQLPTTFNHVIFQGSGVKNIFEDITINGDLFVISSVTLDMEVGGSITGTASGTLSMTTGIMRVQDISPSTNFPTGFGTYNLTGGEVEYAGDGSQDITGGISYFDLQLYSISGGTPSTKTVTADFTVQDDLVIGHGSDAETTLQVNDGVTITLVDAFSAQAGSPAVNWGTDGPTGGTLFHDDDGTGWSLDTDVSAYNNLILSGTGASTMTTNLTISGNLTISENSRLNMEAFTVAKSGAASTTFTMGDNSTLDSEVLVGTAFPTGFNTYTISTTSLVRLDGTSNQSLYTTPVYGDLTLTAIGNVTLDGNLDVNGNLDIGGNTTLVDGGFDLNLAGASVDLRNYTPSSNARTVTFDGADQTIRNDNSGTPTMQLPIVIFAGSGTKTMIETLDIDANMTINSGVTVALSRDLDFSGATWANNGTFAHTSTTLPVTFSGIALGQSIDPGATNSFGSLTFNNLFGTTTIINNGLNIETGPLTINANVVGDFGSLSHTIASSSFAINGTWTTTNANLTFDRLGTQDIPAFSAQDVVCAGSGTKRLNGDWILDDLAINSGVVLDANTSNYNITLTGSWASSGTFTDRTGTVAFESNDTNPKTINAGGSQFYNVTFNQVQTNARIYTISGATTFQEGLVVGSGATLDLDGKTLTLGNNDADDPPGEVYTIEAGGTLEVDAGAILQFDCTDDNNNTTDKGAELIVNGALNVVGVDGNVATITRSDGGNRIYIVIDSAGGGTGSLAAQYYHFQYLYHLGLIMKSTATLDATNNLSNGTWSLMNTGTGSTRTYLVIDTDNIGAPGDINVSNVTFNFDGSPTISTHINVSRASGLTRTITFQGISNGLLAGESFDDDTDNLVDWPAPSFTTWLGTTDDDWYNAGNWSAGVPTNVLEAIVPLGQNIARIDPANGTGATCQKLFLQGDGVLKLINDGDLDIDGDVVIGNATGAPALIIGHTTSVLNVQGSWSLVSPAVFEHGGSTVTFDAPSGSATLTPGSVAFNNLIFNGNAIFNLEGANIDIDNDLTITDGIVTPSTTDYAYTIAGDISRNVGNGGQFIDDTEGEVILDGAAQTISDMTFFDLVISGTSTKTFENTNTIADDLTINSTLAAQSTGSVGTIDMNGDVTINTGGIFDDGNQTTHTFSGVNWIAGSGSYTGTGTITFDRIGTGQDIESVDGTTLEFSSLVFSGTSDIDLFTDVNVTGDVNINNSINTFDCNTYLIDNTSGVGIGTFFLDDAEIFIVEGANNFPSNFAVYNLHANSFTRYYGTADQTIRGEFTDAGSNVIEISYGTLDLDHANTKTLSGNIEIQSDLNFRESTLDVTTNNYDIEIGDDWTNNGGGSFLARNGNVTFNGTGDQRINNDNTGTKDFYNLIVNKAADIADVDANDITIQNDLNLVIGGFTASGWTVNVGGNLNATGGTFETSGTYNMTTTNTSALVRTNGSILQNLTFNAVNNTRIFNVEDDLTINGNFTLSTGTFNGAGTSGVGKSVTLGNGTDIVAISGGVYQIGAGGTLNLGNGTTLSVTNSGKIEVVGTAGSVAQVTGRDAGIYNFTVEDGTIAANNYAFQYMSSSGIFINTNGIIDATDNFSNGSFSNGPSGGTMLKIENTQDLSGANRLENVLFPDDPGNGATNVFKNAALAGDIEIFNASGEFAGENFDQDDLNLITWTFPPTLVWDGSADSDWYNERNWATTTGVDTEAIPDASTNAIIPDPLSTIPAILNFPVITDDDPDNATQFAITNTLTIETGAFVTINAVSLPADAELTVTGDLNMNASGRITMNSTNDRLVVTGNWLKNSAALFDAGLGTVELNSTSGIKVLDNGSDNFYNLEVNVTGTIELSNNTTVSNDLSINNGTFSLGTSDLTVGGNFANNATFTANGNKVTFNASGGGTQTIDSGGDTFEDVDIDDAGGGTTYQLSGNGLTVDGSFDLTSGSFDLNSQPLILGDDSGTDQINIGGTLTVDANETISFGDNATVIIPSGGTFAAVGTDESNLARVTIRNSGDYAFAVESGGNIEAQFYLFEYMDATGLHLQAGSNLHATRNFSDGTFSNGASGGRYLLIEINPSGPFSINDAAFDAGPAFNVKYETGDGGDQITFNDYSGALGGEIYEDDEEGSPSATTGLLRWNLLSVTVWQGGTSSDWNLGANWSNSVPDETTSVIVDAGANNLDLGLSGGNGVAKDVTILAAGTLTISNDFDLTIGDFTANEDGDLINAGTLTITGNTTLTIRDDWTNSGTFNAGTSTVEFVAPAGTSSITTGGDNLNNHFNHVLFDSDNGGDGTAIFTLQDDFYADGNVTITDGDVQMVNASSTLFASGDWTVNAGGTFTANSATVTLDGGIQTITDNGTNPFNNLTVAGTNTKTFATTIGINNDLTINSGSTVSPGSNAINLLGDWANDGTFTSGTSTVALNGSATQSLSSSAGGEQFYNLVINNTESATIAISLLDPVLVTNSLTLTDGVIDSEAGLMSLSDNTTIAGASSSSYISGPISKTGDDDFIFPTGDGSIYARIGIYTLTDVANAFTAQYFDEQFSNTSSLVGSLYNVSTIEYWDLARTGGTEFPIIELYWEDVTRSDVNTGALDELRVAHYDGATWQNLGQNTGSQGANSIRASAAPSSLSPITLASTDGSSSLPVELTAFSGEAIGTRVHLNWTTASELNNDFFEIQRSVNGVDFEPIGTLDGNGTTNDVTKYSFKDDDPIVGKAYYRLRQVDFDGVFEYSPVISVQFSIGRTSLEFSIYPNPAANGVFNITINYFTEDIPLDLEILNTLGELVYKQVIDPAGHIKTLQINHPFNSGLYIVKINQGGITTHQKLLVR